MISISDGKKFLTKKKTLQKLRKKTGGEPPKIIFSKESYREYLEKLEIPLKVFWKI